MEAQHLLLANCLTGSLFEVQAVLTVAFNFVCIGYATLVAANFVAGLVEVWMTPKGEASSEVEVETVEQVESDEASEVRQVASANEQSEVVPSDWMVIEPTTEWHGCTCEVRQVASDDKEVALVNERSEVELTSLTIRELKAMCKGGRVKGYGKMTKAQLVEALSR
jgi:hypothetical protein